MQNKGFTYERQNSVSRNEGFTLIEHERQNSVSRNEGFTLIELLVVISVIGILSITFFVNYRGGEEKFALTRSAHKLAQDIRSAQEKSIATQFFKDKYQGGFGISLTEGSSDYILFVDCDNNGVYDESILSCADCTSGICIGGTYTEKVETLSLEEGVSVSNISPSSSGVFSVVFTPPDPSVSFSSDASEVSISIQIEVDGNFEYKTIKVNKAGLISILQ